MVNGERVCDIERVGDIQKMCNIVWVYVIVYQLLVLQILVMTEKKKKTKTSPIALHVWSSDSEISLVTLPSTFVRVVPIPPIFCLTLLKPLNHQPLHRRLSCGHLRYVPGGGSFGRPCFCGATGVGVGAAAADLLLFVRYPI